MKTLLTTMAFCVLCSVAFAQQGFTVQRVGNGQYIVVPNGPIKTGPRSWSRFDPSNPYRVNEFDYTGRNGLGETQAQVEARQGWVAPPPAPRAVVRTYPNLTRQGQAVTIQNPFAK